MNFDLTQFVTEKRTVETVLDFLPYPFLVAELKDDVFHNVYVNKKFGDEIGYSCEEMPTIDEWFDLAYPDPIYRREVTEGWSKRYESSKANNEDSVMMRVMIHTRQHDDRWYEVKSSTFGSVQLVAFMNVHDVVMKEQELKRLNDNRGQTLSILTHDVRAPLNDLHSLSQLLLSNDINQNDFIDIVRDLNDKTFIVLEFVDTALQWTKSNFDRIEINTQKVDLKMTIKRVVAIYENAIKAKRIAIEYDVLGDYLNTDPEILTIVLRNLISNAIKFSERNGSIIIEGDIVARKKFIVVRDNGTGMNADQLKSIFASPQISSNRIEKENGVGVGLKLCVPLLRRINAELTIESEPGRGTSSKIDFGV
jgi:signal transduction histidine kinase